MFGFTLSIVNAYRSGTLDAREARQMLEAYLTALLGEIKDLEIFGVSRVAAYGHDRAQTGNLAGLIIGITIAAVVGVAVAIPVINDVVADSNATGTTLTVLDLLDLFVGLLILVAIASPLMRRT